jgi:hypothetical protein
MKLIQKIRTVLLMSLLKLSSLAIAAAPVVELSADELVAFVKQHKTVVVQLNSADPKCGYCVGADKIFDQIAAKRYNKPVIFARVQWALWKDFPKFDPSIKVLGAPSMLFFKNGAQTDVMPGGIKEAADIAEVEETVEEFANYTPASPEDTKVLTSSYVIELKPEQYQAFISKNPWAVVQFISSDMNCGYCIGAAYPFNSAARFRVDKSVPFARVQWSKPWRNIPNFGEAVSVGAIPALVVFNKGKKVGGLEGKPQDRNAVFRAMNEGFEKVRTGASINTPPAVSVAPTSAAGEQSVLRLHLRHEYFQKINNYCSRQFPEQSNANNKSLAVWKAANQSKLDEAALLMLKRASQGADIGFAALTSLELAHTNAWLVTKLGIPDNRAPQADDCEKMMGNLAKAD